ncbi:guanylate kinase [Chitinimonas sp. BJYL2]|uniref:guanylate kinase n=1 Tax=Chitinimonas sp. BJYL2 TaxID=2976696 RepID=UPI0027E4BB11|nr:guanylate kinase [Chitinimonas sp. BJYL2]
MSKGKLFIVAGPSGAGKATLVRALLAADSNVQLSISFTTRAPREGEADGRDYHFVSRETFLAMVDHGDFLEHAEVHGNLYGTSQTWINEVIAKGQDILLEIDVQGAQQVRRHFAEAVGIFILPPSAEVLEQRLRNRGTESEEAILRRLANAREEISHVGEFNYVIINEHIDQAVRDIIGIVRAERCHFASQAVRHNALINALQKG